MLILPKYKKKQMKENNSGSKADLNKLNILRIPTYKKWKNEKLSLLDLHLLYMHLLSFLYYHFLLILSSVL